MRKLKDIRQNTYKRNDRIFQKIYGENILSKKLTIFQINPYAKIKTILNLEISCLLIFFLIRTKITPNLVTIAGFFWTLTGVIFISLNHDFFFYLGSLIIFFKLVPDYVDGQLASLKKQSTLIGHELDAWAGNTGTALVLAGFFLYGIHNNPFGKIDYFYVQLIITVLFSIADLRLNLSKFRKVYYDNFLKNHVDKKKGKKKLRIENSSNYIIKLIKYFHFDGSSRYIDFLLLLLIIEKNTNVQIFYIFPIIWSITYFLTFSKSIYLTLNR
jgi:phosphatidylglycerophosphate synthase